MHPTLDASFSRVVVALAAALALLAVASSSARAAEWIPPTTLPGVADSPLGADTAVAPDGTVIAVWTRIDAGKPEVVASVRPPGGGFSTPEPISLPSASAPRIAIDGQGRATVVWMQVSSRTQLLRIQQSTRPAGGRFSVPRDLSAEADESEFPTIAVNSAGTTIVAWERVKVGPGNAPVIEAAARPAGEGEFGPKVQLSQLNATADMFEPQVAVGEDGTGMVAWSREGGDGETARWTLSGGFAAAVPIAASDDFVESPDVAIDAQGTAVFAYFGIEAGARGLRTQTRTAGGSASGTSELAPLPGTAGATPDLVADRSGDMVLTWDEHPPNSTVVRAAVRPSGQGFRNVASLSGALAPVTRRTTAISPEGDAIVAWITPLERVQARIKPRGAAAFGPIQDDFPVRTDITHVASFADPEGNAGVLWRRAGGGDPGTIEVRAFDGAPPVPIGLDGPSDATAGRPAALSASFRDTWSPFTVSWNFGDSDGGGATGASVRHVYNAAGTFTATATARDAANNAASPTRPIAVRALRPDEIDADGDGFSAALDCDDANPRIHPGALEIRGNAVDENCDNRREPFPKLTTNASISAFFGARFSRMEGLRITGLEGGETVRISCKGRGCRKSMRASVRVRRKVAVLKLDKRVRGAKLRKGARLEVRISKPDFVTRVTRFTIRPGQIAKRTELCQPPGTSRPGRC